MKNVNVEKIARICHETNRAYCQTLGDDSQAPWDDAPEWQKESARQGVRFSIDNPESTPQASHESWLAVKVADGWKHGPVKDTEKKEHPCFLPYADLPEDQKRKDVLFQAIVKAMIAEA